MIKITLPTFEGVADDVVDKLDAYEEVTNDVKNKLESGVESFVTKRNEVMDKALAGTKEITDSTKAMIAKAKGSASVVTDKIAQGKDLYAKGKAKVDSLFDGLESGRDLLQVKDRITAALKGDRSSLLALGKDAEKLFATNVLGMDGSTGLISRGSEILGKVEVIKDKVEYYFGNDSPLRVNNVLNFIRDTTDIDVIEFFDLGSEAALLSSVISDIQGWGVSSLLDDIFGAKDNGYGKYDYTYSDSFRFAIGQSVSESITGATDLSFIQQLITHSGAQSLLATNPDFPMQLLSSYVLPEGTVPGESSDPSVKTYSSELALLTGILDLVKPDWFAVTRNGSPVWNLYFISGASEDATTLLEYSEIHRPAMLTAPFYRMDSFKSVARQLYPLIALEF